MRQSWPLLETEPVKHRMTLTEFKAAIARTRMSLDGRATYGALLVLVDGRGMDEAAVLTVCSAQAIYAAISRIRKATGVCPYCGEATRGRKKDSARQ